MILFIKDKNKKQRITQEILNNLPEWFGIPESSQEYIENVINMPFWIEKEKDNIKGFISLKENSPYTCEIYVMGILKKYQKKVLANYYFVNFITMLKIKIMNLYK